MKEEGGEDIKGEKKKRGEGEGECEGRGRSVVGGRRERRDHHQL